jgi:hypothetical protein
VFIAMGILNVGLDVSTPDALDLMQGPRVRDQPHR